MSDDRKKPELNVFSDAKLRLYAEALSPGDRKPSLRIKLYENNPVINVDYGRKTDKGYAITHETPIDPIVLAQMTEVLRLIAKGSPGNEIEFDNWGHPFIWDNELKKNQRAKDKMNISRITLGKASNGEVFIKYAAVKKPEVTFTFRDNDQYHKILESGQEMNPTKLSPISAVAWAKTIDSVYNTYYSLKWEEPEYRKRFRMEMAKKGGQGGYNGGNQNRGGYNNQQPSRTNESSGYDSSEGYNDDYDEELPY